LAENAGSHTTICDHYCDLGHNGMKTKIVVEETAAKSSAANVVSASNHCIEIGKRRNTQASRPCSGQESAEPEVLMEFSSNLHRPWTVPAEMSDRSSVTNDSALRMAELKTR
jgi:hypothetical protein